MSTLCESFTELLDGDCLILQRSIAQLSKDLQQSFSKQKKNEMEYLKAQLNQMIEEKVQEYLRSQGL